MSIVYLNGEFLAQADARISPMDRGFLYADGVYEVIPAYQGHLFRLDAHLDRLDRSLEGIRLANPLLRADWKHLLHELLRRNQGHDAYVYVQLTRGAYDARDHGFPAVVKPTVFAFVGKLPDISALMDENGVAAVTVPDLRWQRCDIKSIALLANVLARQSAIDACNGDAIFVRDGMALEGAASNLFLVKDGLVITPPKSHLLLHGITRDVVLELLAAKGIPYRERAIDAAELASADELWLTSTTREIRPVTRLNEQRIGTGRAGPIWRQVMQAFQDLKRSFCAGDTK